MKKLDKLCWLAILNDHFWKVCEVQVQKDILVIIPIQAFYIPVIVHHSHEEIFPLLIDKVAALLV